MYKQVSIRVGKHIMCLLGVIKKLHMKHFPIRRQFFKIERTCSSSSLQRCHLKMSWLGLIRVQNFSRFGNQTPAHFGGCSCPCIQQPGCLLVRKLVSPVCSGAFPSFHMLLGSFLSWSCWNCSQFGSWQTRSGPKPQILTHTPALLSAHPSEGNTLLHMFVAF